MFLWHSINAVNIPKLAFTWVPNFHLTMNTPNTRIFFLFRLYAYSHVNYSCMEFFWFSPVQFFDGLSLSIHVSRRNLLDSEGWVSILPLAGHRKKNTNSFNKSSRLSFTHQWHQFRTWFFMINGEHFKISCITRRRQIWIGSRIGSSDRIIGSDHRIGSDRIMDRILAKKRGIIGNDNKIK